MRELCGNRRGRPADVVDAFSSEAQAERRPRLGLVVDDDALHLATGVVAVAQRDHRGLGAGGEAAAQVLVQDDQLFGVETGADHAVLLAEQFDEFDLEFDLVRGDVAGGGDLHDVGTGMVEGLDVDRLDRRQAFERLLDRGQHVESVHLPGGDRTADDKYVVGRITVEAQLEAARIGAGEAEFLDAFGFEEFGYDRGDRKAALAAAGLADHGHFLDGTGGEEFDVEIERIDRGDAHRVLPEHGVDRPLDPLGGGIAIGIERDRRGRARPAIAGIRHRQHEIAGGGVVEREPLHLVHDTGETDLDRAGLRSWTQPRNYRASD